MGSFYKKNCWVVKPLGYWTGEWVFAQCDWGLSGWYVMFYAGQYVVEGKANCLGGADMQVRSHFDLWAEQMIDCSFRGRADEFKRMCALLLSRV
jgi:hypothetical protein